jgi:hypothetical protein
MNPDPRTASLPSDVPESFPKLEAGSRVRRLLTLKSAQLLFAIGSLIAIAGRAVAAEEDKLAVSIGAVVLVVCAYLAVAMQGIFQESPARKAARR